MIVKQKIKTATISVLKGEYMEVKLIYNPEDTEHYLYVGESFLNNYKDIFSAKAGYDRATKSLDNNLSIQEIKKKFGWSKVKGE